MGTVVVYKNDEEDTLEIVKGQQLMIAQKDNWNEEAIAKHQDEMIALLHRISE